MKNLQNLKTLRESILNTVDTKDIEGVLSTLANNYTLEFKNNKYYIVDNYGNDAYLSNYNNRSKVFDFVKKYDHELNFADNIVDVRKLVSSYFSRKI